MAFDVSFIYRIIDRYSKPLKDIERKTSRFNTAVNRMGVGLGRGFGKGIRSMDALGQKLRAIPSMANAAGSAFAVMAASIPVNKALAFERAVTDLDKKFNFDSLAERSEFIQGIKALGPALGFTATQMSQMAFEAGKLNIAKGEIQGFVNLSAKAAVAFDGLPIEEAGQAIGDLKNKFALGIDGVESMLDAVNKLADNTTTNGGQILRVMGRLAGQFKTLEFPSELSAGLAAFARQISTSDELAASGMKMFLRELDQAKLATAPIETITAKLRELAALPIAERVAAIEDQFGKEASVFVQSLSANIDLLGQTLGNVADKTAFAGSMTAEFNRQNGTTAQKLERLKAKFDLLLVTIGEKLLPTIARLAEAAGPMLEKFIKFVDQNPGIIKVAAALGAVAAALVPLAAIAGTLLLVFNPIGLTVTAIGAGITAATAAVTLFWDEFKAFGAWLNDVFGGIFDGIVEKVKGLGSIVSKGLSFFGIGQEDPTISQAPATPAPVDVIGGQAAASRATLAGRIGIDVTGPGRVRGAEISSDPPGDLGFNVAAVGAAR